MPDRFAEYRTETVRQFRQEMVADGYPLELLASEDFYTACRIARMNGTPEPRWEQINPGIPET